MLRDEPYSITIYPGFRGLAGKAEKTYVEKQSILKTWSPGDEYRTFYALKRIYIAVDPLECYNRDFYPCTMCDRNGRYEFYLKFKDAMQFKEFFELRDREIPVQMRKYLNVTNPWWTSGHIDVFCDDNQYSAHVHHNQGTRSMKSLKEVLMERDGLTSKEADDQIREAKKELYRRLLKGEMPFDFMEEEFGLEPDYLEELM